MTAVAPQSGGENDAEEMSENGADDGETESCMGDEADYDDGGCCGGMMYVSDLRQRRVRPTTRRMRTWLLLKR